MNKIRRVKRYDIEEISYECIKALMMVPIVSVALMLLSIATRADSNNEKNFIPTGIPVWMGHTKTLEKWGLYKVSK